MKKTFMFAAVFTVFMFSACSSRDVKEETLVDNTAYLQEEEDAVTDLGNIESQKSLFSVEVTIPAQFFENSESGTLTQTDVDNTVDEMSFKDGFLNEDGSVTYKMSKSQHEEFLKGYKESIDGTISDMLNDENNESFVDITYNDSLTQFTISVDSEKFSMLDMINAFAFYIEGTYYQLFNFVPIDDVDVQVDFVDKDTGEVIETARMSEMNSTQDTLDTAE